MGKDRLGVQMVCALATLCLGSGVAQGGMGERERLGLLSMPSVAIHDLDTVLIIEMQDDMSSRLFGDAVGNEITGRARLGLGGMVPSGEGVEVPDVDLLRVTWDGTLEPNAIRDLARRHGAQVVVLGSIGGEKVGYASSREERTRVVKTDSGERKETYTVACGIQTVSIHWQYDLFGADGRDLVHDSAISEIQDKDCDEDGAKDKDAITMASVESLWIPTVDNLARGYVRLWNPSYRGFEYRFPRGANTRATHEDLERGAWARVAEDAAAALESNPFDTEHIEYAAFAAFAAGQHEAALTLLDLAHRFDGEDDHLQMKRSVEDRGEQLRALEALGYPSTPTDLPALAPLLERADALLAQPIPDFPEVEVRGPSGRWHEIYAAADKKSATTGELVSSTRVFLLEEGKKMSRVLLPDGETEAWIKNRSIKDS